jgi:hypothetical protein
MKTTTRQLVSVPVLIAALLAHPSAEAQSRCASSAQVERLEAQGMQLNQSGDHESARQRFERASALCPTARVQARMAITLMALERWTEASLWMNQALAWRDDPWVSAHRAGLEEHQRVIARHADVAIASPPVAVEPAPRSEPPPVRVEHARVPVVSPTIAPPAEPPPAHLPRSRSSRTSWLVLGGLSAGLAAVGLGVGAWATAERFRRRDDYDLACPEGYAPTLRESCEAQRASVEDTSVVAPQVAGFVAAGALAITSVVFFAAAPSADAHAQANVRCGPGPGTLGVGCVWRF